MKETETSPQESVVNSIEVPKDSRGRIRWQAFKEDPVQLAGAVESVAQHVLSSLGTLNYRSLESSTFPEAHSLMHAAGRFYPGGLTALRKKLEGDAVGYEWNLQVVDGLPRDKNGRVFWSKVAEEPDEFRLTLELEASRFLAEHGRITQATLKKQGRGDIVHALHFYPGGLIQLKESIGLKLHKKPDGYWTVERIEQEAFESYRQTGGLTTGSLKKEGRTDLIAAVQAKYSGSFRALRRNLGITETKVEKGYWTQEKVEEKVLKFYEEHGRISWDLLRESGESSLAFYATRYPGGMSKLREVLGIDPGYRPLGYWTPEVIEQHALQFYREHQMLNQRSLAENGRQDLVGAIFKKYPGKLPALKDKLGIESMQKPEVGSLVPASQANEQLGKLLDAASIETIGQR